MILFTTPLQAMGEEYALPRLPDAGLRLLRRVAALRRLPRSPAPGRVALLLTSALFALAHGTQNFPLFFDRFAFGLMAGSW